MMNTYILDNDAEYQLEASIYLEEWIEENLGATDSDCSILEDVEISVCEFMKHKINHMVFTDGFHPDDYPYTTWLEVSVFILL